MMKRVPVHTVVSLCILAALLCHPQIVRAQDVTNDYSVARRGDALFHLMEDDSGTSCEDDIPGSWRLQYFGTTNINSTTCAVCDPDGDGYSNLQEYNLGTDPTNSASYPTSVPAGLVVWWKLDEGTNTTVADSSGNEHSGSLQGDPLPVWTNGVVSGALNFDGSQNFVGSDCAISQTFTATTMECWFTADSVSGENPAILTTVHDDNPDYAGYLGALSIYNPDVRPDLGNLISFFMIVNTAGASINAFDGNYHHAVGVWDGSRIYLYYDGTLMASTNTSSDPVNTDCYVRLAYEDTNGGCFLGGNVGEIRIYNRALSSNEVVANYNTDSIGDGIPDWWRYQYFGSGTTTNDSSCASCDPESDGLSNLQKYQLGLNPFVSYAVAAPPVVVSYSSGNTASVSDAGTGTSYSWSIDNGTIDSGDGTPSISWSAGDSGRATISMQFTSLSGSATLTAGVTVSPCSLAANITAPSSVLLGSTNTASLPNPLTTLYNFTNGVDGANPVGVLQGTGIYSNFFYGVAGSGGTNGNGTIFAITPFGLTNLWQFNSSVDGNYPWMVMQGIGGSTNFYGVTPFGGPHGSGTVFALTLHGLTNVFAFGANSFQGGTPTGVTQGRDGILYGVTDLGGSNGFGVIFSVATNGSNFQVLHHFSGVNDGTHPLAGLIQGTGTDTNLYGMTHYGPTNNFECFGGCGTVFRISPTGVYSNLHTLHFSTDGSEPTDVLTKGSDNNFYGVTFAGGTNGYGTVFQITTQGVFTALYSFSGGTNGQGASCTLAQGTDGNFYGSTLTGGSNANGTVIRITPMGSLTTATTLYQFNGTDGSFPFGSSAAGFAVGMADGYLYGATEYGGASTNCGTGPYSGCGIVYKFNPSFYSWSISGGTIIGATNTPNITWRADSPGGAIISVTISNFSGCSTTISTTVPITAYNEWYGPFNSWTNVSAWGADGGGTNDDTGSINSALAAIGLNGCSPVLYCPGKYKITNTLTLDARSGVAVVGKDSAVSGFIWGGGTGSSVGDATTMFHVDGIDTCFFERLFFDGQNKSYTLINHSQTGGGFDNANTWQDCRFINTAPGGLGVAGGLYFNGFSNEAFLRCILSNCTTGARTYYYNALDGWFVNSYFANCGVGLHLYASGSLHAYQSVFVNCGTDIWNNTGENFSAATGNTSWHARAFYIDPFSPSPVLLKGNTIIDPASQPIQVGIAATGGQQGPLVVMDNTIAYTNGTPMSFASDHTTVLLLGNTNCVSPFYTIGTNPSTNVVDNATVSRSSLTLSQPGPPTEATNLNRTIVDMPRNMTSSSLQSAINGAADGTVIHIPFTNPPAYYSMNATVTIPTNRDIRIIGDGISSKFSWDGGTPLPMFSMAHPSHATFSHLHLLGNPTPQNSASLIKITGVGSTAARVYLRDSISRYSTNANFDLGDCPNTTIDWRGNNEENGAGAGLRLEGRGMVKFITTDSGQSGIDAVTTNGGTLYIEASYNEDGTNFFGARNLLTSGASTVMILCGIQHEQSILGGGDGFYPNGGTTNAFGVTNFSGIFTMSLVGGISDWVRISGTQSGNVWLEGDTTFRSPTRGGSGIPTTNTTISFIPTQTQNWDYGPTNAIGFAQYSDIGTANVAYTRTMFAPSRSTYSDLGPMARRTNQTDVLIEDSLLDLSLVNLQVLP